MAVKRVTMQDIADACRLSRNTVSKVFNGRGAVPPATRALILQKARDLGYAFPAEQSSVPAPPVSGTLALLTHNLPVDYHFGTYFVTTFTDQITRAGYTLKLFEISDVELQSRKLPPYFFPEQISGIITIELFDADYLNMVCRLGLPTIAIDSPAHANLQLISCDIVLMENVASIVSVVRELIALGARHIGFVGDREHCGSFGERWVGYRMALSEAGLPLDERICILSPDASPYNDIDWLIGRMDRMPLLPDAFICANDYLAVHMMNAIKKKGLSIPGDVMVTGFDGTSQSALVDPPLTTVQIPSVEIGRMAADLLLDRIHNPELPFSWTHIRTTPVWRSTTRKR